MDLQWSVEGSYYEVCNCEAVCPCRRADGQMGGRPMYEACDFAISWWIKRWWRLWGELPGPEPRSLALTSVSALSTTEAGAY